MTSFLIHWRNYMVNISIFLPSQAYFLVWESKIVFGPHTYSSIVTLRKKCFRIKSISFQKHVYHWFKSICYRISYIFIGSCSIFLWINSIHAFGKKFFWFNSIFFSVYNKYLNVNKTKYYFSTFGSWSAFYCLLRGQKNHILTL